MATNVFANMFEVSSKAGSGKSALPVGDICFTPPPTPAGVEPPVPYPNMAQISDLDKGSSKVLICNKPVALEKDSYMKTSTGNEAAKPSTMKGGIISKTTKGKAYYTQWSSDVKYEGKGVCRHIDLTSWNHASQSGNGAVIPHMSGMDLDTSCKDNIKKIDSECSKKEDAPKNKVDKTKAGDDKVKAIRHKIDAKYCEGLNLLPTKDNAQAALNSVSGMGDGAAHLADVNKFTLDYAKSDNGKRMAKAAAAMSAAAEANPCVNASRCVFKEYKNTDSAKNKAGESESHCCPGQSGHHVIPEAMGAQLNALECWPGGDEAPTICVEGVNNAHGTHGIIHQNLLRSFKKGEKVDCKAVVGMAAQSVLDTFPDCDKGCSEQQLESNKKKDCNSCSSAKQIDANSGAGRKTPVQTIEGSKVKL